MNSDEFIGVGQGERNKEKLLPTGKLLLAVTSDSLYQQWNKQHPKAYLSHFFCQIDNLFALKSAWDIGFYDPAANKITVFTPQQERGKETIIIKPADDIFQKEPAAIEALQIDKVKVEMESAVNTVKRSLQNNFSQETLGDGFLILQAVQGQTLWNFTFITRALRFVNVKIDAQSGEEFSHEQVNLVQK
ncbi:MAG: hypothetical protein AABX13_06655 [Nanoarchaeota archaeon]